MYHSAGCDDRFADHPGANMNVRLIAWQSWNLLSGKFDQVNH